MDELTVKLAVWLGPILTLLAISGCIYALFAAALLRRFAQKMPSALPSSPGLTLLKPLCGGESELETNLASFCRQDYGGSVQLVFGIQDPADPAGTAVGRLRERFPEHDIELVADPSLHGSNRKVSNLVNMLARADYDIFVVSDSDIRVGPEYLREVVSALSAPEVGLVTCLYPRNSRCWALVQPLCGSDQSSLSPQRFGGAKASTRPAMLGLDHRDTG